MCVADEAAADQDDKVESGEENSVEHRGVEVEPGMRPRSSMARNSLLRNFSQRMGEQGTQETGESSTTETNTGTLGYNEALKGENSYKSVFK